MVEAVGDARPDQRVRRERAPTEQQIVQVEHRERPLACAVGAEGLGERVSMLGAPGEALCDYLTERPLRVDRAGVDVEHRLRAREAPRGGCVTLLLAHEVEQVGSVGSIEDAEPGG